MYENWRDQQFYQKHNRVLFVVIIIFGLFLFNQIKNKKIKPYERIILNEFHVIRFKFIHFIHDWKNKNPRFFFI